MNDAAPAPSLTAAAERLSRAIGTLEKKAAGLKAQAELAAGDDLFAPLRADDASAARISELEAAGREASLALSRASDTLRALIAAEGG